MTTEGKRLGIELTPEASIYLITDTRTRLADIGAVYGFESPEMAKAARSLAYGLLSLIGLGGQLSKAFDFDGIDGRNEFISYGLVFHAEPTGKLPENMKDPMGTWGVHS